MVQHGKHRALVAAAALALWAGPGWGACRLALALGFDVSRSVDAADYRVQRDGILAALPRARLVQRNRLRLGAGKVPGVGGNALRAGRGAGAVARTLWGRLRR